MLDVYALLIPIKEKNAFLLFDFANADCELKGFSGHDRYYFYPITQCYCSNHLPDQDCINKLLNDLQIINFETLGYCYISKREITKTNSYTFYTILLKPMSVDELKLDGLDYSYFPRDDRKDLYFGPELKRIFKSSLDFPMTDVCLKFILPLNNYESISFEQAMCKVHASTSSAICNSLFTESSIPIQRHIYEVFMELTYPSCKMGFPQFYRFMKTRQKFDSENISQYFKCFLHHPNDEWLSFSQFLIGSACMDAETAHGGQCGELRSRYIFRYYDRDSDGILDINDLRKMVQDIHKLKPISSRSIDQHVQDGAAVFELWDSSSTIDEEKFLNIVGNLKFRGTSVLFRFPYAVSFSHFNTSSSSSSNRYRSYSGAFDEQSENGIDSPKTPTPTASKSMSNYAKTSANKHPDQHVPATTSDNVNQRNYELALHSIKVRREGSGLVNLVRPIWDDISNPQQLGELANPNTSMTYSRLQSINTFNEDSFPNEILQALLYFRYPDPKKGKIGFSWGDINMEYLGQYLMVLCEELRKLVSQEPRMLEISNSPTYILGDLHGNYVDLVEFEEVFWRLGINMSPGNFLFLGDYVDRGEFGVEVITYLFAQKLLNPKQLFLLRGNHEIRSIQKSYTFYKECISKFGPNFGDTVWKNINSVFDALPVAAVIDNKLFCVHGGIPRPSLIHFNNQNDGRMSCTDRLAELRLAINSIPCPLSDPELESDLAWEIMWSDPFRTAEDKYAGDQDKCIRNRRHQLSNSSNDSFEFGDYVPPHMKSGINGGASDANGDCDEMERMYSDDGDDTGFTHNKQRQTACFFDEYALNSFLNRYGFSHVIRAHEVHQIGFNVEHQAQLITVFSSSHYCNKNNEAACLLVNNEKLRLIRLDTS